MKDTCEDTPQGSNWPVCSRLKGHEGLHESEDFIWSDEDTQGYLKDHLGEERR